ncbi:MULTISPECIES: TonB-dependent receptor [unclassified Nitrobacter]|uniref:TonB-dependent receptor plug domain-containing protein n=1 Tax=unclassified Nitrobacter TaxID=2620411 RepID=UPI0009262B6C|nr:MULTISPECIES: TonB-dependent receptor [unclassified Nitrobacter]OJV01847.1 MAG: TonB-dependent receptor [Nitrobacter sp. 62-23]
MRRSTRFAGRSVLLSSVAIVAMSVGAEAQDRDGVYQLGEIYVSGAGQGQTGVGGSTITREEMWTFGKQTLDQAVNLVPGVVSTLSPNGQRNETDIFVRGFGRWQVPLMIDGVRVYLPADNRLDFSRFLTNDIAEIQIQKGYASVLDGPGGMGGAINLVSRKPVKPFEGEFSGGAAFDNRGAYQGWNSYAMLGSRQEKFYVQGSANYLDQDFWSLSRDYRPFPAQGSYRGSLQDGGRRDGSDSRDWRVNLKAGFTPNATDEYSINFIKQSGSKGAPLNVYNNPPQPQNYWLWPAWDIQNLSFMSSTQLGDASYVKTKLYYNTFYNLLSAFDDITYTKQALGRGFNSYYDDNARGGSVEAGTELIPMNTLKAAFHYREDSHTEWNHNQPTLPSGGFVEPKQNQAQTTYSLALENTFHVRPDFDLVGGISYDDYWISKAQEYNSARGIYEYPKGGANSFNWQTAAIWRYSDTAEVHFSVSDRARFPTIFELYSQRFGTAIPNPNLGPERATNYELGWKGRIAPNLKGSAAIFYSDVRDLIQAVRVSSTQSQTRNINKGEFYGFEMSLDAQLSPQLTVGGNYTFIERDVSDVSVPGFKPGGVPTHKAFLYASWRPIDLLTVTPSLEIASDRWSEVNTSGSGVVYNAFPAPYIRTGAYTLANVNVSYMLMENVELAGGVKNLFDQNYELAWGLPQPGRTFYLKAKATF